MSLSVQVMAVRTADLVLLCLAVLCTCSTVYGIGLSHLVRSHQRYHAPSKRGPEGNHCTEKEKPFPCKTSDVCIPISYLCDDNPDCPDGYDEDTEVCTAALRPPVENIIAFLNAEQKWIIPNLFSGKNLVKVAHGLAVSQTVDEFKRRLGLSTREVKALREALQAVKDGDEHTMESLGMPPNAWDEVVFFFNKLIKSGFHS